MQRNNNAASKPKPITTSFRYNVSAARASTSTNKYLFDSADQIPGFKLKAVIATLFLEVNGELLLLKRSKKEDQSYTWGIPGGKLEENENGLEALKREMREETGIDISRLPVEHITDKYASIPNWNYILKIYKLTLDQKPTVILSDEHTDYKWVKVGLFKSMKLLLAQDEAFNCIYNLPECDVNLDAIRSQITNNSIGKTVINLIGTSGSGKGTQGVYLSEKTGLPHISIGDLFRDEIRNKTLLGDLILSHDAKHPTLYSPDEICLGIMATRLSKPDCNKGFILDGFPRTPGQTESLLNAMMRPEDKHIAIFMDLNESIIRERLKNRYICPKCGTQVRGHDGASSGSCSNEGCNGAKLEHRAEDCDEVKLNRRFGIFNENIASILQITEKRDPVFYMRLDGKEPPKAVAAKIDVIIYESLVENRQRHYARLKG